MISNAPEEFSSGATFFGVCRLDTSNKVAGILRSFFLPDTSLVRTMHPPSGCKTATALCNTRILKIPVATLLGLGPRPDFVKNDLEVRTTDEND